MQKPKKSEIYSVGNFDLQYDAKQALGARTHESISVFAILNILLTRYILPHFVKYSINWQIWFLTVTVLSAKCFQ